jgi:hypothetical protein
MIDFATDKNIFGLKNLIKTVKTNKLDQTFYLRKFTNSKIT